MRKISFFTHSTSLDNEVGIYSGHKDVVLSAKGIEQANQNHSPCRDMKFDRIYCSGLARAQQTAKILFPEQEVECVSALNEMDYGTLNGQHKSQFPTDEFEPIDRSFKNGENCLDVEARMRGFLASVKADNVAIISHKYPQLALEVICNGLSWRQAIEQDWRSSGGWKLCWQYVF